MKPKYKRVLLKFSGEALQGKKRHGIDLNFLNTLALRLKEINELKVGIAIVLGGGNIFRGEEKSNSWGIDRSVADYMGMLSTVINGLALQDALERIGVQTRVMTAIEMHQIAEPYIRRRAIRHLEKRRIIIFVAGTGNPYFTTDTAAALRAKEIGADVMLKATKVEGVYSADPLKESTAKKFNKISYIDVIRKRLKVIDSTAVSLCMDNNLPIVVFSLSKMGNIKRVIMGEKIGTSIG